MTKPNVATLQLRIVAIDPPFAEQHGILFGPQRGREVDDFKGQYVHGKVGDRFLYLSWGQPDAAQPFLMFARAKIKLGDIPADILAEGQAAGVTLVCELQATNHKGHPASGTIRSPDVVWSIGGHA